MHLKQKFYSRANVSLNGCVNLTMAAGCGQMRESNIVLESHVYLLNQRLIR